MTSLNEDLTKLRELKLAATRLNKEAKQASADRDRWQAKCMERMEMEGTDSIKIHGIPFSAVRNNNFATVQDRDAFIEWAKDNAPELVKTVERGGELNSLVRAAIDDGEELPPGVGFYNKDYISVGSGA